MLQTGTKGVRLAAGFFATAFLAAGFLATAFFLAAVFFATAFLAVVFFAAAFLAAGFAVDALDIALAVAVKAFWAAPNAAVAAFNYFIIF